MEHYTFLVSGNSPKADSACTIVLYTGNHCIPGVSRRPVHLVAQGLGGWYHGDLLNLKVQVQLR